MSLQPLPESKVNYIVKNVLAACDDINKLTKAGYDYLYLASGFIAHFNRFGFMDYYRQPGSLKEDILRNAGYNLWLNFRPGERDYEYYHQKGEIYQKIVDGLKNDPRKKFRIGWAKVYRVSGEIDVVAETQDEALNKVSAMVGDLEGEVRLDPDENFLMVLKEY